MRDRLHHVVEQKKRITPVPVQCALDTQETLDDFLIEAQATPPEVLPWEQISAILAVEGQLNLAEVHARITPVLVERDRHSNAQAAGKEGDKAELP